MIDFYWFDMIIYLWMELILFIFYGALKWLPKFELNIFTKDASNFNTILTVCCPAKKINK